MPLLAVLMPAVLVTVVASDMVTLMLPAMAAGFGASEAEIAWVVTGYLLAFSVGIPVYGRVADRVPLRRLFTVALAGYVVGNVVCALAPTLPVLVAGRILTGAGAAALPVLSVVAITRLLPEHRRGTGIGLVSAASGIGAAAGPALGGVVGQYLGWPALFWLMAASALVLLPLAARTLTGQTPPGDATRFDLLGGVFLGGGAGLALFGMTQAQVAGFAARASWVSLLAAAVLLALFAWRTVRAAEPFAPPELFANRAYRATVLIALLAMVVNLGGLVLVPLLVVEVNGLDPGVGALVMIPAGIAVAVLSPAIGRLTDRWGTRSLVVTGLGLMALAGLCLSTLTGGASVVPAGAGVLLLAVGFILVITPIIGAAAGTLPPERVGVGLGLVQGAQFLGAGAGPALFGALVSARRQSDAAAVNPLHSGADGAAYSDAFLAMAAIAVLTTALAYRLAGGAPGSRSRPA